MNFLIYFLFFIGFFSILIGLSRETFECIKTPKETPTNIINTNKISTNKISYDKVVNNDIIINKKFNRKLQMLFNTSNIENDKNHIEFYNLNDDSLYSNII